MSLKRVLNKPNYLSEVAKVILEVYISEKGLQIGALRRASEGQAIQKDLSLYILPYH